ncbi:hypothetical protein K0M31_006673 [Melipona bicolor]|uniref:Uncharacterized protein n=1 Tax=Melipona bicolor TaxID=60889 RepID=A0AA40FSQ5_9HYME|nr:hypothetical protein K0M31_006673 [Melipona bicolor]
MDGSTSKTLSPSSSGSGKIHLGDGMTLSGLRRALSQVSMLVVKATTSGEAAWREELQKWKCLNQGRLPIAELELVPSRRQYSLNNNLSERFISLGLLRLVIIITDTFSSALNRSVLPTAWVGPFANLVQILFPNRLF